MSARTQVRQLVDEFRLSLWQEWCRRAEDGTWLCRCGKPMAESDYTRCRACQERHDRDEQARELERERDNTRRRQRRAADLARAQLPRWPVATPVERVVAAMHPRLQQARERYRLGDCSLLITGPSGAGKTIWCADAVLRYAHWAASDECDPCTPEAQRLDGFVWVVGHDLVRARREVPLGQGDAELITRAKRAGVLVLDELTAEPESEVPFEVVDARYSRGAPTIVTSGLTPEAFRKRYGAAMWRRLAGAGHGGEIDLWAGSR